jgi:uncharacterized lipoprotein YddW (UPF0748 family)
MNRADLRSVSLVIGVFLTVLQSVAFAQDKPPDMPREFRAVFVTVAYNFDWPSSSSANWKQQHTEMLEIVAKAKQHNLNVIILQVRAFGDRISRSSSLHEGWSDYVRNDPGPGNTAYDPLAAWIRTCHDSGLELHAWINPFRVRGRDPEVPAPAQPHDRLSSWYKPTDQWTRDYLKEILTDLFSVQGIYYDIAKIEQMKDVQFRRRDAEQKEQKEQKDQKEKKKDFGEEDDDIDGVVVDHYVPDPGPGGTLRTPQEEITDTVAQLFARVKQHRPGHVKFGISPLGEIRAGQLSEVEKWVETPLCHYVIPEVYMRHDANNAGDPFAKQLEKFVAAAARANVNPKPLVVAGLGTYQTHRPDDVLHPWEPSHIVAQIAKSQELIGGRRGQAHYSWSAFRFPALGTELTKEKYAKPALVPECFNAIGTPSPDVPAISVDTTNASYDLVKWKPGGTGPGNVPWLWEVWYRIGNTWTLNSVSAREVSDQRVPKDADRVAVRAVNRYNRASDAAAENAQ